MTYEETVLRMVRLMYFSHQSRWVDLSLRNLTGDWLRRIEERFAGVNGGGQIPSTLQSFTRLDQSHAFVEEFFKKYLTGTTQLVSAEDKAYFLAIAQRPGQKPVPFIPILDASFEVWFKKVRYPAELITAGLTTLYSLRILCGKRRTSTPFSIKTHSVSVFFRVPLQLPTSKSRMSQSRTCSATSRRTSSRNSSTDTTTAMPPRFPRLITLLPLLFLPLLFSSPSRLKVASLSMSLPLSQIPTFGWRTLPVHTSAG
jgi:hypothetical protein